MKLFIICLFVSLFIFGCSSTNPEYVEPKIELSASEVQELLLSIVETPEPTSTLSPLIDSKTVVVDELSVFNALNNSLIHLLRETQNIYEFDGSPYHKMYVATLVINEGLNVYESGLRAWKPIKNDYSKELAEIRLAELYRLDTFRGISDSLLLALIEGNEDDVTRYTDMVKEWGEHPDNKKPMLLQRTLLKDLGISPQDVNFMYSVPEEDISGDTIHPLLEEKPNDRM